MVRVAVTAARVPMDSSLGSLRVESIQRGGLPHVVERLKMPELRAVCSLAQRKC